MLNILIMGAGAIGCFVGGHLAAAGHRVTLVGRARVMEQIAAGGLTIRWPDQPPRRANPATTTSLTNLANGYDVIILTVKAPDTAEVIRQFQAHPALLAKAHLVSLQNGLGNEEQLAAAFGPDQIIAGTITIPIQMPAAALIEVSKAKGGLGLAPMAPGQPLERLAAALTEAGLTTLTYADYQAMKWSKLLLNIVNNATSAILDLPPAQIISNPDLFNLEIRALQEGLAVMQAQGIAAVNLPGYPVRWLARILGAAWLPLPLSRAMLRPAMAGGRGSKMPSLHIDLANGRTDSEIGALNGAIVRAGQVLGIATPVNRVLTDILSRLFAGELAWADYRGQPQKLLAQLE
jgi:2-dehydropantoate 2-reductase